jgi:hypothetical protein
MIEAYAFGSMVFDGVRYDRDLIVLPDRVVEGWRRKEGHRLRWADLAPAVESGRPESVVIGTGRFGRMRVEKEIGDRLAEMGVSVRADRTDRAVRLFNDWTASGTRCIGAFHLTC